MRRARKAVCLVSSLLVCSTYDIIIACIFAYKYVGVSEIERNHCYGIESAQFPFCLPWFYVTVCQNECFILSAFLQLVSQFLSFSYELLFYEKSPNRFSFLFDGWRLYPNTILFITAFYRSKYFTYEHNYSNVLCVCICQPHTLKVFFLMCIESPDKFIHPPKLYAITISSLKVVFVYL